ncbi:MAG: acetylornithine transaminase [Verrucomicrobium sp.]|nr:acetylornithine transaminase [Verrucomicrobium sp.]
MNPTIAYDEYVLHTANRSLTLLHGQGATVFDDKNRPYLDFGTGIAVSCLGHDHPALAEVYARQSRRLIHCSNLYRNEHAGALAERLVGLLGPGKIFYSNSGAEANEGLIKAARLFGKDRGAFEIVCTKDSFHGRTMATLSATGQEKVQAGFAPLVPGFVHVPYNDLEAVRAAITPRTAAVLIEGIQGESGILPADPEYLLGLRALTREKNVLLFIDAIQCGHFRTGAYQSFQRILGERAAEFRPDGLSMAKSLGGGFPIGAFWLDERLAPLFTVGSHNTTYGGSPLGTAVAGAVLDVIEREGLAANVRARGEELLSGLRALQGKHGGLVAGVRGFGALVGLQLAAEPAQAMPHFLEAGLLVVPAGNKTVRYLPPYNVTAAEVADALARTDAALAKLAAAA